MVLGVMDEEPSGCGNPLGGGENCCAMLLGDASCGALRKKGTDGDEERANEPPSSYQNSDKPYPRGTWAHQRVLSLKRP